MKTFKKILMWINIVVATVLCAISFLAMFILYVFEHGFSSTKKYVKDSFDTYKEVIKEYKKEYI